MRLPKYVGRLTFSLISPPPPGNVESVNMTSYNETFPACLLVCPLRKLMFEAKSPSPGSVSDSLEL